MNRSGERSRWIDLSHAIFRVERGLTLEPALGACSSIYILFWFELSTHSKSKRKDI